MYSGPLFLRPSFHKRIWGGTRLNHYFRDQLPSDTIGEAWVISAHKNGPSQVLNQPFINQTLNDVWMNHPELFNRNKQQRDEAYPLLVKLLDAKHPLSVQVHPDDTYAQQIEGETFGKTECWYILEAEANAEIIFGHNAQSKKQFEQMARSGKWEQLFKKKSVKRGDFIYIPSGTLHAIGPGIILLEIQQNSDITYRVYDYDRADQSGKKRELHLEDSLKVISIPHHDPQHQQSQSIKDGLIQTRLITTQYFTVYHWRLDGISKLNQIADFIQVNVINGEANLTIDDHQFVIKKGDNFILPATIASFTLKGFAEFIVSHT